MSVLPTSFGPSEKQKLIDLCYDGVQTLQEIESLRESMKDTINAIGEELNIPASLLTKVIKTIYKGNFAEQQNGLQDLEKLLDTVGKK